MMKKIEFADQKIFTYFPRVGENVENLTIDEAHDLMRSNQSGCIRLTQNTAKTVEIHECPYCGRHDFAVAEASSVIPEGQDGYPVAVFCVCGMTGPSASDKIAAVEAWNVVGKKAGTKAWARLRSDL